MAEGPRIERNLDQLRLVIAALAGCLGDILAKADPTFRPEIIASVDQMLSGLKASGGASEETLHAVERFRRLVL